MSNVFKLGKGPEQCPCKRLTLNSLKIFDVPPVDNFVKSTRRYDYVIFTTMSDLYISNYPDLHMSVSPAILKFQHNRKKEYRGSRFRNTKRRCIFCIIP
jgi:hypothetical protein